MNENYVKMESHLCPICGAEHETEAILLHKHLRPIPAGPSDFSTCEECQTQLDNGFIALIEIDPDKSRPPYKVETVIRTGQVHFLRQDFAEMILDPCPPTVAFIDNEAIDKINSILENTNA